MNSDWQKKLTWNEWDDFLNYSKNDSVCNEMWIRYKAHEITYNDVNEYEYFLYKKYIRTKLRTNKINKLINQL